MPLKPPVAIDFPFPAELTRLDAASDRASLVVLRHFDESASSVRRYVLSFGVRPEAADDVVQEVFLSLFRHLQLGRPDHNLRGWTFRVAHNLALKQRKRQKTLETRAGDELTAAAHVADAGGTPEEQLVDAEWQAQLRAIFLALPDRERRCVYLRAQGLRYREIADVLGVSLGAVAKYVARAMAQLGQPRQG